MILTTPTHLRQEIISQFPIAYRDEDTITIENAVSNALERAFRDINFRTLTRSKDLKLTENEKITPFLIKKLKE